MPNHRLPRRATGEPADDADAAAIRNAPASNDRAGGLCLLRGAYFFAITVLVQRFMLRDLRINAYINVCRRIVLAVVVAFVATEYAANLGIAISRRQRRETVDRKPEPSDPGFLRGAFSVVRPANGGQGPAEEPAWLRLRVAVDLGEQLPLTKLSGLNFWHASRLEEEGIDNVPGMATSDIVSLVLNTQFSAATLVAWIDEAILLTSLAEMTELSTGADKTNCRIDCGVPASPEPRSWWRCCDRTMAIRILRHLFGLTSDVDKSTGTDGPAQDHRRRYPVPIQLWC